MIIPKNLVEKNLKYFTCCHQNLPQVVFSSSLNAPASEIIMVETVSAAILVCLGWSNCLAELRGLIDML